LHAGIERAFRAAFDLAKVNNGSSVAIEHVLAGAIEVVPAFECPKRILFRYRAILSQTTFRAPAATLEIQFQCGIKRTSANAGLSTRDDFEILTFLTAIAARLGPGSL